MKTRHIKILLLCLTAILAARSLMAAEGGHSSANKEKELLAVLRSNAPKAEKALACKNLAVHGSQEAVPELARLLSDEELASWARIPLEAIPGSASDDALRKSLDSLHGKLLVGAINSIGVRRDPYAVDALAARLENNDSEVASAAAVALGHIANDAAIAALRKSLSGASGKVRSAVAEGLVLCAERLLADGRSQQAIEIYDQVRKAELPKQRVLEATRGAILARGEKGVALLLEQLQSSDKVMFQLALGTARELPGSQIEQALMDQLGRLDPPRAALVVQAVGDRLAVSSISGGSVSGDTAKKVVLPALLKAAGSGPKEIRLAAAQALGKVGDASCLASLVTIATESDPEVAQAAKSALADLPGDDINQQILGKLNGADTKLYASLVEVVGERRIVAVPALVKALDSSDQAVRRAALKALGQTVSARDLGLLISQVVSPKHSEDAAAAQQALKAAAVRMRDREACAAELAAALEKAPSAAKPALLDILAAVGGTKALAAVGAAAKSPEPELQDTASRLLGEWMTIDAAPVLLDLVKTAPGEKYQSRALRGYVRIARQFVMPEAERLAMCERTLAACRQPSEKKLVLDILKRYPSRQTLNLAIQLIHVPELKNDATQAALAIAQKLGSKVEGLAQILAQADLGKVKIEIVKAEYGAGDKQKDVTDALRKHLANVQLITLAGDYNTAFGGDPAPGTPKQLKIQYRLNDKPGEAAFAENAVIILPSPK